MHNTKNMFFCFLMGLNDSYGNLIGQILLIEPFPTLSKVCSLVLQEEKRRNISNIVNVVQQVDAVAMYVNNNRPFQGAQGQNKGGGKGKKDRPICTYCGFTGHIVDKCYKLHGYPPGYKLKGGNRSMVSQVLGPFGFDVNNIGFPNVQSNVLPTQGVQSDGMIQNLVNTPFGVQTGFQNGVGNTPFGTAHVASGNPVGGVFQQQNSSSYQPQCPISPA